MYDRAPIVGGNGSDDSHVEIFRISKGTRSSVRLTHNNVWDGDPSVSPDGSLVAFDTGRWGWLEVAIMNADGSNRRRLTFELRGDAETPPGVQQPGPTTRGHRTVLLRGTWTFWRRMSF